MSRGSWARRVARHVKHTNIVPPRPSRSPPPTRVCRHTLVPSLKSLPQHRTPSLKSRYTGADLSLRGVACLHTLLQLHTTPFRHEALHPQQCGPVRHQRAGVGNCGDAQGRVHRVWKAGRGPRVHLPDPPQQGACSQRLSARLHAPHPLRCVVRHAVGCCRSRHHVRFLHLVPRVGVLEWLVRNARRA